MKLCILYTFDTRNSFFVSIFQFFLPEVPVCDVTSCKTPNFPNQLKALKVVNKLRSKVGIWDIDQRKNEEFGGFHQI